MFAFVVTPPCGVLAIPRIDTLAGNEGKGRFQMSSATIKRIIGILVGMFMLTGTLQALNPVPAHAEIQSGSTVSYSSSEVTDETVVTAVANSDVQGKVNLEFIVKGGITYKGSCPKVSKVTSKLLKSKKCFVLKSGKFVNSGRNRAGKVVYFTDSAKNTKFIKKGSSWRKANCGNYVRFKTYPSLKASGVAMVESFGEVSVSVKVTAKASVTATAEAWCKSDSSSARGTGSASGTAEASAEATASAKTEVEAKAKASSSIRMTVRNQAEAEVKAEAAAKAKAKAEAQAVCTETAPPTGEIGSLENINDVVWGNAITIRVTGTVPDGETATLKSSADIGTIADSDASISVTGNFDVKLHYTAPTEGSSDTVTVKLYSSKGVKWDEKSDSFTLGRPATP